MVQELRLQRQSPRAFEQGIPRIGAKALSMISGDIVRSGLTRELSDRRWQRASAEADEVEIPHPLRQNKTRT
jgi:hypothetical protein